MAKPVPKIDLAILSALFVCGTFAAPLARAATPPRTAAHGAAKRLTEIQVSLFGQPCILSGSQDVATLKRIHAASPDQLYPKDLNAEQLRVSIEKLRALGALPQMLDRYRDRLGKRFEAEAAFFEALDAAKKSGGDAELKSSATRFMHGKRTHEFNELASKIAVKDLPAQKRKELGDQLLGIYEDDIEPDPEEDFHRAIGRLNVQYTCNFGEDEGEGDEGAE